MTPLRTTLPLLATLAATLGACTEAEPPPPPDRLPGCFQQTEVVPSGQVSTWVVDRVYVPMSAAETNQLSLNVDCDQQNRPDNSIGRLLSTIYNGLESSDINDEIAGMIGGGRLLHLLSIDASSLEDATGVGVTLRHGLDQDGDPSDNFDGDEPFAVDSARGQGSAAGVIMDGRLSARGSQLPIGVTLPSLDDIVILPLVGARVDATVTSDRLDGRIAGAIPEEAVDDVLIPVIYKALLRAIERDCPDGVCEPDSFGDILLAVFDNDADGTLELDEFRDDELVQALLASDVDLFDEDGMLNPRSDGINDSLSLGVSFTAVPAQIQD